MKSEQLFLLRSHVISFRRAILRTSKNILPISFRDFPEGSCGDACLLLAKFLEETGYALPTYVTGSRGPYSHAWLELDGVEIDITADQFSRGEKSLWAEVRPEICDGVMVTDDRSWHEGFDEQERYSADLRLYDASTQAMLYRSYRDILTRL